TPAWRTESARTDEPTAAQMRCPLIQPGGGPRLQHVFRRDPGPRQAPGQQVHPQVPGAGPAGPGVPLPAPQRGGAGRLGRGGPAPAAPTPPTTQPQPVQPSSANPASPP